MWSVWEQPEIDGPPVPVLSRHMGPSSRHPAWLSVGMFGLVVSLGYSLEPSLQLSSCFKASLRVTCMEQHALGSSTCLSFGATYLKEGLSR